MDARTSAKRPLAARVKRVGIIACIGAAFLIVLMGAIASLAMASSMHAALADAKGAIDKINNMYTVITTVLAAACNVPNGIPEEFRPVLCNLTRVLYGQ